MENLDFDALENICREKGLVRAERNLSFTNRFNEKLGHLRDKTKFVFNRNGEMDF